MRLSKYFYYLSSIPTLLLGIMNINLLIATFAINSPRTPLRIALRTGLKFYVRSLMDIWIIKETCLDRDYERIAVPIEDNWTVIDIGAGIGEFSILAASQGQHNKIYAYEPFLESYHLLKENATLNRFGTIEAFQMAVAATNSQLTLAIHSGVPVLHSTVATQSVDTTAGVQVESISLDGIFAAHSISTCDFLKVDCEGGEYDIFFSASKHTLGNIKHICLEYHNGVTKYAHTDLISFFQAHGFRVRCEANPVHAHTGLMYAYNPMIVR